jgi:polyhydroxyalkanoate synthesis regulator phasin
LQAGKSLADIATSAGSTEQAVINLLVQQSTQRMDQAVSAGKMTQDQADQFKAKLSNQIKNRVENKGGFAGKGDGNRQGGQFKVVASF